MRGNAHVRFGGRARETERPKGRHRASVRPYYVKVRNGGRVVSMAALLAVGVESTGERRILGLELAAGNDKGNAVAPFLRGLIERSLWPVSDWSSPPPTGPRPRPSARRFSAPPGRERRCARATHRPQAMVASAIRSNFEQPDEHAAPSGCVGWPMAWSPPFQRSWSCPSRPSPICSSSSPSPRPTGRGIWSTNPQDRLNEKIKRRTAVVGSFPTRGS